MNKRPPFLLIFLAILLVVGGFSFATDATTQAPEPVAFEGTNEGGLSFSEVYRTQQMNAVIPRAEAFYSQTQYVTGYYGIRYLVQDLNDADRSREFGRLLTVYVSDFADTGVRLDKQGRLHVSSPQDVGWTRAEDAYFVVESQARTTNTQGAIVPFSDSRSAKRFAQRYKGKVIDWDTLRQRQYNLQRTQRDWEKSVSQRQSQANRTASQARELRDRPVSINGSRRRIL